MNDRGGDVTANAAGTPFFAMTLQTQVPGADPAFVPTAKRLEGGTGNQTWSTSFNITVSNDPVGHQVTDIFVLSDGFIGVSGFYQHGASHIDRILHPGTGAIQSAAQTKGAVTPRQVAANQTGEYFASFTGTSDPFFEYSNYNAVKFVSRKLWRTVYFAEKNLYDVVLLGVNASNRPVVLRARKDGLESGLRRVSARFYDPVIAPTTGTDYEFPAKFTNGIVDGHDVIVFNDHQVRRFREPLKLNNDVFSLPFATQLKPGPGALFLNDNGFGGGLLRPWVAPAKGTVEYGQDGSFTYTKGPNFDGSDSFMYRVTRDGVTETASVVVNDLKIVSVTFDNLPVIGGERTDGRVNFSHVPDNGEFKVVENSNLVGINSGAQYPFPTTNSLGFAVSTQPVTSATNVAFTARMHGLAKTGVLTLHPGAVTQVTFSKNPVIGGETLSGTVHLNGAAPKEQTIDLQGQDVTVLDPVVTIPPGATSATFNLRVVFVSTDRTGSVSARSRHAKEFYGTGAFAHLTILARPRVISFVGPASMAAGSTANFSVNLDKVVPYNYPVNLSSGAGITVPASVTVTPGNSGKSFPLTAANVTSPTVVTMTATTGGTTVTKMVQVNP